MNTTLILIIAFCLIVYLFSMIGAGFVMVDKEIDPDLLSIFLVIFPIVNTIVAIRYSDLRKTMNKLKK